MSRGRYLILGMLVGASGLLLYLRLRQVIEERDPEFVIQDITRQIEQIESRIGKSGTA